jgi:lysozyme family protein
MLVQSLSLVPGGLGAPALVKGQDFNCNVSICYGIGAANDALFQQLQMKLNTLSGAAGFAPIRVDGFIGRETLAALAALKKIGFDPSPYATKEAVAANARTLVELLTGLANIQETVAKASGQPSPLRPPGTPVRPPGVPATPPSALPPPITAELPPGMLPAAALPQPKSKLGWIGLGLVAALAVGGLGYVLYRRRAQRSY